MFAGVWHHLKKKNKLRWIDKLLFLMLLQNPALSDDLETERNG